MPSLYKRHLRLARPWTAIPRRLFGTYPPSHAANITFFISFYMDDPSGSELERDFTQCLLQNHEVVVEPRAPGQPLYRWLCMQIALWGARAADALLEVLPKPTPQHADPQRIQTVIATVLTDDGRQAWVTASGRAHTNAPLVIALFRIVDRAIRLSRLHSTGLVFGCTEQPITSLVSFLDTAFALWLTRVDQDDVKRQIVDHLSSCQDDPPDSATSPYRCLFLKRGRVY